MEAILQKKTTGASCLSWRCPTVHTRGHKAYLCPHSWLTAIQGHPRLLLFYTPAKGYRHVASDLTIRDIMHEADFCKQAEEQVSRCDKVYGAEGSDCHNSTTTTFWPVAGKAVSCDYSMVCARVSCLPGSVKAQEY
jgi:hypothetical protein